jgi:NAD(P)-dependent dehydrogenase (short-subunit alcohol dehydrogenase family)
LADRPDERRVVLVTGASRGVGAATVDALTSAGSRVVAVSRSLAGRRSEEVVDVSADLADPGSAARVVAAALDAFGRLDGLVNNAGLDLAKPLLESTVEETRRVFAINALAPLWMIQAATPALAERGGAIVNVTSRLAHVGVPEMAVYGASKGALRALTHGAAVELGPIGVRVNAVAPGMTETPLFREWLESRPKPELARADVEGRIPLGRLGRPADVANAIVFLLSDAASHITGATLPVDGGYTAA